MRVGLFLVGGLVIAAMGCKSRDVPADVVGSYVRAEDGFRAELSIARGGMVLTVVALSGSVTTGGFASLFKTDDGAAMKGGGTATALGGIGRTVLSSRTFESVGCSAGSCKFELAAEKDQERCGGTFEKTKDSVIVVATGACTPYAGRWVAPGGAGAAGAGAPATSAKLDFPADIPQPHNHMSCLDACSIVDTRCHRDVAPGDVKSSPSAPRRANLPHALRAGLAVLRPLESCSGGEVNRHAARLPCLRSFASVEHPVSTALGSSRLETLPDARDGLTRKERVVLWVLAELQAEHGERNVPLAQLYGRVLEHIDLGPTELQEIVGRLGARRA